MLVMASWKRSWSTNETVPFSRLFYLREKEEVEKICVYVGNVKHCIDVGRNDVRWNYGIPDMEE